MISHEKDSEHFRMILKKRGFDLPYLMQGFDPKHDFTKITGFGDQKIRDSALRNKLARIVADTIYEFMDSYGGILRLESLEWVKDETETQQNIRYNAYEIERLYKTPSFARKNIPYINIPKINQTSDDPGFRRHKNSVIYARTIKDALRYLSQRFGEFKERHQISKPAKQEDRIEPEAYLDDVIYAHDEKPIAVPVFGDMNTGQARDYLLERGYPRHSVIDTVLELQKQHRLTAADLDNILLEKSYP